MCTASKRRNLLVAVVSLAIASCQPSQPSPAVERGIATRRFAGADPKLPNGWQLDAISSAVPDPDGDADWSAVGTVHVLAWKVSQDDRPITVERCLVLKEFAKPGAASRWVLASVCQARPGVWFLSEVQYLTAPEGGQPRHCVWVRHCKTFEARPTNTDVYAFMDEFEWGLAPRPGWRLLRGRVCTEVWRSVIGAEPTRFFHAPGRVIDD